MRVDHVKDYAHKVLDGKIIAGPSVRAACARHLKDIDTASKRGLWFDHDAAEHVFGYFEECLRLRDGQFDGQPFRLAPSQKFVLGNLFGWKNDDGTRRFRQSYDEEGKGNGKSPLAAGVALYLFSADDESSAEVYFAAPTKQQAFIAFDDAVGFVDRNEELATVIRKKGENPVEALTYPELDAKLLPISADAKKKSGYRPNGVIVDEVHELGKNGDLIDMLRSGFKFRRNPLLFMITNSGFDRLSICWKYHEHATKVAAGSVADDSFFAYVCELDKGDDPLKDEKCWPKANPLLGITTTKTYIRNEIRQMRTSGKINLCLRLNFCQWTSAESSWLPPTVWEAVQYQHTPQDVERLKGRPCWGGLDLSRVRDLTVLTLMFPNEDETIDALSWFWTPADTLHERQEADGAPYSDWANPAWEGQDGLETFLNATPGPEVDYGYVAQKIQDLGGIFEIKAIAFDAYEINRLRRELDEIGCDVQLVEHAQGARMTRQTGLWMPGSINLLESSIYQGKIRISRNPVMTMCAMSAACLPIDPQGNRIFSKQKATRRIDGAVTLAMARGALEKKAGGAKAAPSVRFIRRSRGGFSVPA